MREKCKYYKKTYNNVWIIYYTLAVKFPALTQYNVKRLGQSKEAGIKPTVGGSLISHFLWYSISCLYSSRLKTDSFRPIHSNTDVGNTKCLRGRHWWRNTRRSYSKLLLLLLGRVHEVWGQLQYHHQTRANFVTYGTSTNTGDGGGDNNGYRNGSKNGDNNVSSNGDSNSDSDMKKTRTQDEPGTLVNHKAPLYNIG